MLTRRQFTGTALAALAATRVGSVQARPHAEYNRLVYSCDGHAHDRDDIGSSAMALALLGDAGYQPGVVHFDYCCPPLAPQSNWATLMQQSVEGAYSQWGHRARLYNDLNALNASVNSIAGEINASGPGCKLAIIAAGPMEIVYRALSASNRSQHPLATIVTHSPWNNTTGTFDLDRIRQDFPGVGVVQLPNQNQRLNTKSNWGPWTWLRDSHDSRLRFIWDRMRVTGRADVSDAGMAYFAIYGKTTPTINDLRNALT